MLCTADERFRSLRAVVRRTWDSDLIRAAAERAAARMPKRSGYSVQYAIGLGPAKVDPEPPRAPEKLLRIWYDPPRLRQESSGHEESLLVSDGQTVVYDRAGLQPRRDERPGTRPSCWMLFAPAGVAASCDFEIEGRTVAAGREALVVRARPRRDDRFERTHNPLNGHADEIDLLVDAERGVLLRAASLFEGKPLVTYEVLEIAFDEEFADILFEYTLPEGATFQEPEHHLPGGLTLDEAARRATFPLLAPTGLDPPFRTRVSYHEARERPAILETVVIHYLWLDDEFRGRSLLLVARRRGDDDVTSLERIDRDGQTLWVEGDEGGTHRVVIEHGETSTTLMGDNVRLEELIDVALSLRPVT